MDALGADTSDNLAAHFLLDPDVTFLNHGSFGACPAPVFAAYQGWQRRLEAQPVAFLDPVRGYAAFLRTARRALAAEVGAEADDLVGVMNATVGLNIAIQSLALSLAPGDEILTCDHEYGALDKTWDFVCARTGAEMRRITLPMPHVSVSAFTDAMRTGLTDRTRILFLSHITSPTALVLPIARIVAEARALGILVVIDGAHVPGHMPLDLGALDADIYAGNCHKWLMAPKGSAFLHIRRGLQERVDPLVISHGWSADRAEPGPFGNTAFVDRMEMQGTRDPSAFLAVPDAIAFRAAHDWDRVGARCHDIAQETAARVARLTGIAALSSPDLCAPQMVSMPVPRTDPVALQAALMHEAAIEIPCFDWHDTTIVRLSVQGYNSAKDMDLLVTTLDRLLVGLPER